MPPSTSMNNRNPAGLSERCGVSTAEKIVGSRSGGRCRASWRSLYGNNGAQDTSQGGPQNGAARRRGERRRACARRAPAAAAEVEGVRASASPPTARPPPARCRNGQAAEIEEAFRRFQAAEPEPEGELEHIDPFTLLVAVVLSAQATDAGVNKATPALFAAADTPAKMAALGEARVQDLIKTIGLFRTKAKNVVALSQKLVEEHGGEVPRTREALEALPGVGRKTANVVLNVAFGEPTIAVDTHIFRVGNRTGLATGKTPFEVEMKLEQVVPAHYKLPRPPLADPARALRLRRAPAAVREMPDRRPLQVAGQDSSRCVAAIGLGHAAQRAASRSRVRHDLSSDYSTSAC